jgi:hypothetical protein
VHAFLLFAFCSLDLHQLQQAEDKIMTDNKLTNVTLMTRRGNEVLEFENRLNRKEWDTRPPHMNSTCSVGSFYWLCMGMNGGSRCKDKLSQLKQ